MSLIKCSETDEFSLLNPLFIFCSIQFPLLTGNVQRKLGNQLFSDHGFHPVFIISFLPVLNHKVVNDGCWSVGNGEFAGVTSPFIFSDLSFLPWTVGIFCLSLTTHKSLDYYWFSRKFEIYGQNLGFLRMWTPKCNFISMPLHRYFLGSNGVVWAVMRSNRLTHLKSV